MIKEAENVCHQGSDTAKTARANHLAGNFSKEAFDEVEPGRGGWRKMQMKAGMALKPGNDLGMFVSGVVVADDVNIELGGNLGLDLAQEGQPLLMAMTRGGMSKDLAREIVQGGKQSDRSMTVVIVGLCADMTLAQGQTGLTALEGLTLALLIATEQEATIRRVDIMVGLRPRPGASLSPSRPLDAQRFLQRTMAKRLTLLSRYLFVAESLRQAQDDPSPENIPLTACLGCHDALEFPLLFRGHFDRNGGRHNHYHAATTSLCHHISGTLH
jgi:hypothetical protein